MNRFFRKLRDKRRITSVSRLIAVSFLGIILIGALLLSLPYASRNGHSAGFTVSLFTATSATCVTGLVLADTWTQWSGFGQIIILMLIEIGGLGLMSILSLAYFSFRRKMSIQQQFLLAESMGEQDMGDLLTHQKKLLFRAFTAEGTGALLLTLCFLKDYSFPKALKLGVFHSVSAFCNAGFDIMGFEKSGLAKYQCDPFVCIILSLLIILGGLGFLVWDEVISIRRPSRWSVYTRLVLLTSGALLLSGTVLICMTEWVNPKTLGPLSVPEKILAGFFQSTTLRTAGFSMLDQSSLTSAGKGISIFYMLIGGSSGSTAGGLKTVTFVVLLLFVWNRVRGNYTVHVFHRTISEEHVMNALIIFVVMISFIFFSAVYISATSPMEFTDSLFESVSAMGTVGLSSGGTFRLSRSSQFLVILLMYFGRVGILTLSVGFLRKKPAGENYRFANTDLLIG